ncbi:MAG TPA: SDR family oxidoreductase [Oxalicibacterium sp.]|uniref:SDR family NAD(P)-dependent oxidoreductase n=1 Tax=Oxalicibacterium sp. TaxID=2766525 RepID=UPI002BC02047|nr:SDR family oxidoreductase [Oxalicibacterium sp.]HWU98376.1 SDR family oxidoreductase [Oxalicibacterium sp.]
MRLNGKTAFITGGNSGIGLATARRFIAEGAKVAITGRSQKTLDAASAELGPNLLAIQADLADMQEVDRAVKKAAQAFGHIDIVFANAGIGGDTPVGSTTLDVFENIIKTNLTSVFFTVQSALPYLGPKASIVLNGSVLAFTGNPGSSAYAATKGAVRSMTSVLAAELAPRGIRVNQVSPGATRTPIWDARAPSPEQRAVLDNYLTKGIPSGRLGEPEEIANTVLFLASDESSNITAADIAVDGGAAGAPLGALIYRS